jgi:Fe-S-cluster containining protein
MCEDCDIEEKIHVCCGRHPETGARLPLRIGSRRVVRACRFLDAAGMCIVYAQRPGACRVFFCDRFDRCDFVPGRPPGTDF